MNLKLMPFALLSLVGLVWGIPAKGSASPQEVAAIAENGPAAEGEGIRFSCPGQLDEIESGMEAYLASLKVPSFLIVRKADLARGTVTYTLDTPAGDTDTLNLAARPDMAVQDDIVRLLAGRGKKERKVGTVSKKEILLALLQHGRLTEFREGSCSLEALKDYIGVRQNIVAWAENLEWGWPDGGPARWNGKYWNRGTPKTGISVQKALGDAFLHQRKYAVGCYTAAKLVTAQGVLDYYGRVKKHPGKLALAKARLLADNELLTGLEPGRVWDFEPASSPAERQRPGKLLKIEDEVATKNFVPGDWAYFLNTDPVTYRKTGYEGSTAIYLGRNRFADYYNDNHHAYTYHQKLDEVFQWRNGVFSRSRDSAKMHSLTLEDLERLSKAPAEGGLLLPIRVSPYLFGYENLPDLAR